jgi:hypothetical protein
VELDPNFAEAWRSLAAMHNNIDQIEEAMVASQKAYDLRGRVSELERLQIESTYYIVRGDTRRVIEILQVTVQAFPRSYNSWNNLANNSVRAGLDDQAVRAYRHALELGPEAQVPSTELIKLLIGMNRVQEARQACVEAANQRMEPSICRLAALSSAARAGDTAEVKRQLDRIATLPEKERLAEQKSFAAFQGGIREAREESQKYNQWLQCGLDVPLDSDLLTAEAMAGRCDLVESDLAGAKPPRNDLHLPRVAFSAAACRDSKRAQTSTAELLKISPNDTFKSDVFAPCVQARAAGSGAPLTGAVAAYDVTRKDT